MKLDLHMLFLYTGIATESVILAIVDSVMSTAIDILKKKSAIVQ